MNPVNRELMIHFLFSQFAQAPRDFYEFIRFYIRRFRNVRVLSDRKKLAERYMIVLSFLCERFGFFYEKRLLDDLCFRIIDPEAAKALEQQILAYKERSKKLTGGVLRSLKALLREHHFKGTVIGRFKNLYSIHKKLQKKNRQQIEYLHDIFAFRIITEKNSIHECFEIMNLLHDEYLPLAKRFKDYITIPKINGYQSLHTALNGILPHLDLPIEVQIRTPEMHAFAAKGLACHALYAHHAQSKAPTEKEKKLVDYFSSFGSDQQDSVYCFTYTGDVLSLRKGVTILDFAHHIHSDLGRQAQSAYVNDRKESLDYRIQDGDHIQVLTS
ncbi:MAG: TGS domain-containing protein [bacterium]|nr:TGS domain-containing protein [bacterium]